MLQTSSKLKNKRQIKKDVKGFTWDPFIHFFEKTQKGSVGGNKFPGRKLKTHNFLKYFVISKIIIADNLHNLEPQNKQFYRYNLFGWQFVSKLFYLFQRTLLLVSRAEK